MSEVYGLVPIKCLKCNKDYVPGIMYVKEEQTPEKCMKCPSCGDSRRMTREEREKYESWYKRIEPTVSIPVSFDVLGPGIIIRRNQRIGTISYGSDLSSRDTWLRHLKQIKLVRDADIEKYAPWIRDFEQIYIPEYKFVFTRKEILGEE